jgi:hypothetical protein
LPAIECREGHGLLSDSGPEVQRRGEVDGVEAPEAVLHGQIAGGDRVIGAGGLLPASRQTFKETRWREAPWPVWTQFPEFEERPLRAAALQNKASAWPR